MGHFETQRHHYSICETVHWFPGSRPLAIVANTGQMHGIVNSDFKATLELAGLQSLFEVLKSLGYRLVGPRARDRAIVMTNCHP